MILKEIKGVYFANANRSYHKSKNYDSYGKETLKYLRARCLRIII